jgi:hypothetical protein
MRCCHGPAICQGVSKGAGTRETGSSSSSSAAGKLGGAQRGSRRCHIDQRAS